MCPSPSRLLQQDNVSNQVTTVSYNSTGIVGPPTLSGHTTQLWRRYYVKTTSFWRNYVKMTSFWRYNDVIITSCVQWAVAWRTAWYMWLPWSHYLNICWLPSLAQYLHRDQRVKCRVIYDRLISQVQRTVILNRCNSVGNLFQTAYTSCAPGVICRLLLTVCTCAVISHLAAKHQINIWHAIGPCHHSWQPREAGTMWGNHNGISTHWLLESLDTVFKL